MGHLFLFTWCASIYSWTNMLIVCYTHHASRYFREVLLCSDIVFNYCTPWILSSWSKCVTVHLVVTEVMHLLKEDLILEEEIGAGESFGDIVTDDKAVPHKCSPSMGRFKCNSKPAHNIDYIYYSSAIC